MKAPSYILQIIFALLILIPGFPSRLHASRLVIDLKTDYLPGVDFFAVKTTVDGEMEKTQATLGDLDFVSGERISEYDLEAGRIYRVQAILLGSDGAPLPDASRAALVSLNNPRVVSLSIRKPQTAEPPPEPAAPANSISLVPYISTEIPRIAEPAPPSKIEDVARDTSFSVDEKPAEERPAEENILLQAKVEQAEPGISSQTPRESASCSLHSGKAAASENIPAGGFLTLLTILFVKVRKKSWGRPPTAISK